MWRKTWFGSTRSMNVWLASPLLWRSSKVSELRHFSIFYKNNHTMPIVNQTITIGMTKITFILKFKWYQISLNQNKTVNKPFLPFVPEKREKQHKALCQSCVTHLCVQKSNRRSDASPSAHVVHPGRHQSQSLILNLLLVLQGLCPPLSLSLLCHLSHL